MLRAASLVPELGRPRHLHLTCGRPARLARGTWSASASLPTEQQAENWSGLWEPDCLIKTKHYGYLRRSSRNVISAQCSECQRDEIQASAGKRRE